MLPCRKPCRANEIQGDCVLEREHWNAFKSKVRDDVPLGRKLDHRYYERVRKTYKTQRENISTLDPWLARNVPELQVSTERGAEDNRPDAIRRDS